MNSCRWIRYIVLVVSLISGVNLCAQKSVRLHNEANSIAERRVTLESYLSPGSTTAVIVCPGGSYCWLARKGEGREVAKWLQQQGINAFVLRYRVAGWWAWATHYRYLWRGNQQPDMFDDAHAALLWVSEHASHYGIDTNRIGMIGFSAGGHLVMTMGCYEREVKPAFVAPIYPVVTMTADCVHKRSRRGLLGERGKNDNVLRQRFSLENQVPTDCPPVFLVNCQDDPTVDYHNSVLLDSALTTKSIPHRYILYRTGGHGFGVSETKGTTESRVWKEEFIKWLRENNFAD